MAEGDTGGRGLEWCGCYHTIKYNMRLLLGVGCCASLSRLAPPRLLSVGFACFICVFLDTNVTATLTFVKTPDEFIYAVCYD